MADETKETPVEKTEEKPAKVEKAAEKVVEKTPETKVVTVEKTVVDDKAQKAAEDRATAAETALHAFRVEKVLNQAASDKRTGIRDGSVVAALVKADKITFDDKGEAQGLKEELERIKKAHPGLFYDLPGSADGGAGGGVAASEDGNAWLRRRLGH